jgi:hypothetical protein
MACRGVTFTLYCIPVYSLLLKHAEWIASVMGKQLSEQNCEKPSLSPPLLKVICTAFLWNIVILQSCVHRQTKYFTLYEWHKFKAYKVVLHFTTDFCISSCNSYCCWKQHFNASCYIHFDLLWFYSAENLHEYLACETVLKLEYLSLLGDSI